MMAAHRHKLLVLLTTTLLGLLVPSALADGKAFSTLTLQPTMPDQRAMIVWDGSVQTLLIDTTIEGADAATAWVVPVPAEPKVFAVDRGVFPTLQTIFQPQVRDGGGDAPTIFGLLFLTGSVLLAAYARRYEGWGCLAAAALLFLACLSVLALLPALGTARSSGAAQSVADASPLISREQIGLYDVSILHGPEAQGIIAWLEVEGFAIDQASREAIAAYVAEDWWFVASTLITSETGTLGGDGDGGEDGGSRVFSPHPLGLRFAASGPIYPMRLTGTQDRDLRVDLFVFSSQMATASGFSVRRCGEVRMFPKPELSEADIWQGNREHWRPSHQVVVGQVQLRELVDQATIATWLTATLSPAEMGRDVSLVMKPATLQGNRVISQRLAKGRALVAWAAAVLVGSLVFCGVWRKGTPARVVVGVAFIALVMAPIVFAGGVWLADRGVAIRRTISTWDVRGGHQQLLLLSSDSLAARIQGNPAWAITLTPAVAEVVIRESLHTLVPEAFDQPLGEWQNPILGIPMREVAEPGGYRIWHDEAGVWYAYYDLAGRETVIRIWSAVARTQAPQSG